MPEHRAGGSQPRSFHPSYVVWETYGTANDLNQYTTRTISGVPTTAAYDHKGNLTFGLDSSTYVYDAQNRLTSAAKSTGPTMYFTYDGLNRQVSRKSGTNGTPTFNVWDGWNLIEEYQSANNGATTAAYLYGAGGLISGVTNGQFAYYFQDASGSTSHLTDANGNLLEWYRYDLQGTPIFYNASDQQISASAYGVSYLFTGQQWRSELGLYDLRNRFYSPNIGRFLQPDPIGFLGDRTNLYRYCGNNPVTRGDPNGTFAFITQGPTQMPPALTELRFDIPIYYVGGTPAQQAAITRAIVNYWSGAWGGWNITVNVYQGDPNDNRTNSLLIAPGDVDFNPAGYPPALTNRATIYLTGDDDPYLDQKAWQVGGYFLGTDQEKGNGAMNQIWPSLKEGDLSADDSNPNNGIANAPAVIVTGPPLSKNEQAKLRGLFRLAMMHNPYWGYLPTTNTTNWAGGVAGPGILSPWDIDSTNSPTLSNFGNITIGMGIGAGEPVDNGCFVAGTPVLMADGSEKRIESIQVGEWVLAWNEETEATFSTKVVSALHHGEKMQTLFHIELEDGRKFTVNNNHPMYVVEDGDFAFTGELAGRFAKGEPITFQDSNNQPVKIASVRMRRQICKVYNLHVERQGKNGHTYYANGILVHNLGARTGLK